MARIVTTDQIKLFTKGSNTAFMEGWSGYKSQAFELAEKIPRTKVAVEKRDGEVRIVIEADDQTALRAALNSYIRWTNVAEETAKEAGRR